MTPAFSFGLPFIFVPLMIIAWIYGGWTILAVPIFGYVIITIFDFLIGTKMIAPKFKPDENNKKYDLSHSDLRWKSWSDRHPNAYYPS